jgi:hypothetical protein
MKNRSKMCNMAFSQSFYRSKTCAAVASLILLYIYLFKTIPPKDRPKISKTASSQTRFLFDILWMSDQKLAPMHSHQDYCSLANLKLPHETAGRKCAKWRPATVDFKLAHF